MKLNGLKIKFINAELVNAIKLFNIFYCVGSWKVKMWQLRCGTNLVLALIRRIRVRIELCMYICRRYIYATMLDFYRMIDTKRTFCPCRITTKTNYMYVCYRFVCAHVGFSIEICSTLQILWLCMKSRVYYAIL